MKNLTASLLLLALVFLPVHAHSKMVGEKNHGKWTSFILLGDKRTTSRMVTPGIDESELTVLAIESYPGTCEEPMVIIIWPDVPMSKTYEGVVTGSMRVDKRSIFDIEYVVQVDNSNMMLYPRIRSMPTIFKDLIGGAMVRFKINPIP